MYKNTKNIYNDYEYDPAISPYTKLKSYCPTADALYEDKIIALIGQDGFNSLRENGKIEACAIFNGRVLYAI